MSEYTENYVNEIFDSWFDTPYNKQHKSCKRSKRKQSMTHFNYGDRVKLKYGKQPMVVEDVSHNYIGARYEKSNQYIRRYARDFVMYYENEQTQEKGNDSMKGKLFQTTAGEFGIGLAINSKSQYVLEMKGSGKLEAFDKNDVEVVMPFTFAVKYTTSNTEYQYLGKQGSVQPGDLLLSTNNNHKNGGISIAQVTRVNTKSERATKYFEGAKIKTESLDAEQ